MKMHTAKSISIPARSACRVLVDARRAVNCSVLMSPNRDMQFGHDILIAYVYGDLNIGKTEIWVTNISRKVFNFHAGTVLCTASIVKNVEVCVLQQSKFNGTEHLNNEPNACDVCVSMGEGLTVPVKQRVLDLIRRYQKVFSEDEKNMGKTSYVKHVINTGDQGPIHSHPYRTSFKERKEIRKRVEQLLQAGVVAPSTSPSSAPVVLIPKKDGNGFRFCVDYRKLNTSTKKDVYPLPRIEDALDHLGGAKFFSTLDSISGFYQIEVDEKDQEKTAFITPDGLYHFKRMPMGLCNSPATFQRLMDTIFCGMQWTTLLIYLDDIIVYGKTFDEMCNRLELVFMKLQEAGLTLKPSKCRFGEERLKYLGHIISAEGIAVNPVKIESVVKFPVPRNLTEVRRFVNLCGYYRRFVKNFARLAVPLHALMKKDIPFLWGEKQQESFEKLKLALVTPPVLCFPREDLPVNLHTDASAKGLRAVLCHVEDGKEKVIAYASRSLNKMEAKYTTSEQECLAIVYAVAKFRPYIWGRPFTVITDHHALRWLFNIKDPTGRLARWALQLQSYDMTVEHKPGKIHNDADALSRAPQPYIEDSCEIWALTLDELNFYDFQRGDPSLAKLIDKLQRLDRETTVELSHNDVEDYSLQEGILYRASFKAGERMWKLCVPRELRSQVMSGVHADETGGHLGSVRMYYLLSNRFYWNRMYRDVRRFVQSCKTCDLFRPKYGYRYGAMQTFTEVTKPFQRIGIDFIGPFKVSSNGNKYGLVMIDHISRYIEASAVPQANVTAVIDCLHEKIIFRHSCPLEIVLDRGSQFLSALMKAHAEKSRYKLRYTAPYHPQSNGITERANKTLKSILKKFIEPNQTDWDLKLCCAVFSYNISIHESTKFSPFYLVFGREARIPADLEFSLIRIMLMM